MYSGQSDAESAVQSTLSVLNLHSLSTDELKQLLNDDDQLNEKINNVGAIQSIRNDRDVAVAGNKSLAEYNLAQQPRMMELKSRVRLLLEDSEQLQQQIREKRDKLSVVDQPLDTTLALLQTAAAQAEEDSENMVQSMLASEMSLENFLELYLPKRCSAIVRRVKVDKMKELVRSQGGGGGGGGYRPPAPAAAPYPPAPTVPSSYGGAMPYLPYPSGGGGGGGGASPYPPAATPGSYMPPAPAVPYPYMPGGMPMPRF